MTSKLLIVGVFAAKLMKNLCLRSVCFPHKITVRQAAMIPKTQYNTPFPKRFKPSHIKEKNWEIIPVIVVTGVAFGFACFSTLWALKHKVDVVFTKNRSNLSRTMDLREPVVCKLVTINQQYEPWPEMQNILDKMKNKEEELLRSASQC